MAKTGYNRKEKHQVCHFSIRTHAALPRQFETTTLEIFSVA